MTIPRPLLLAALVLTCALPARALTLADLDKGKFQLQVNAQTQYMTGKSRTQDAFSLKQMRLAFDGKHPQWLDLGYRIQYETTRSSGVVDAYVELARKDLIADLLHTKGRLGQTRRAFSYESFILSDTNVELINRSKVVDNLVPSRDFRALGGRDIGGFLETKLTPGLREDFMVGTVGVFNGEGAGTTERNKQKEVDLRLTMSPRSWLSFGGSMTAGRQGQPTVIHDRKGAELILNYGPFHARGEYIYGRDHRTLKDGWYAHTNLMLYKNKLMASARYEEYDPNKSIAGDRQKQTTVGLNYWMRKEVRLAAVLEMERQRFYEDRGVFLVSVSL